MSIVPGTGDHYALTPISGADQLDGQHLAMPRVKIVQPTSQVDGGQPGEYFNTMLGTSSTELRIVPLRVQFGRVWFDKENLQGDVQCASDDSIHARAENVAFPGRACAECPMSEWSEGANGKRIPPPCAFTYSYVAVDTALEMPVQFTFMKTAVPAARQLNTMIRAFGTSRAILLRTREIRGDLGRYWVPTLALGDKLTPDEASQYAQLAHAYGSVSLAPEEEPSASDEPAPPPAVAPIRPVPRMTQVAESSGYAPPNSDKAMHKLLVSEVRRLANDIVASDGDPALLNVNYERFTPQQLEAEKIRLKAQLEELQADLF